MSCLSANASAGWLDRSSAKGLKCVPTQFRMQPHHALLYRFDKTLLGFIVFVKPILQLAFAVT